MKSPIILLDLDGVLVKDKDLNPFPDSAHFLKNIRELKIPFRVVSNNSTRPPHRMLQDLKDKGIELEEGEFISPLSLLGDYLKEREIKRILFLGMPAVEEYLKELGFDVVQDYQVEVLVIGQDRTIDFMKLKLATSAVFLSGAKIFPVNLSRIVKDDDGLYFPGAGSIALAIAHACNYKEDIPSLGKPSREFIEYTLRGLEGGEVYLVSDDIYTDLIGARELGIKSVFMTTGKYKEEELKRANFSPDLIFHSLGDLLQYFYKAVFS
ncbi:MAG: HAD-IIA family hydrolase [Aquificaceae bacterium]